MGALCCRHEKKSNGVFDHQLNKEVTIYEKVLPPTINHWRMVAFLPVENPNTWLS